LGERRKIVDDSYNANPSSMRVALQVASEVIDSGQKVGFILGDMLELGRDSERYHQEIGQLAAEAGPMFVVGVGEFAKSFTAEAARRSIPGFEAESPVAAAHIARKFEFDVLLVKASRGVRLDKTVETLLQSEQ